MIVLRALLIGLALATAGGYFGSLAWWLDVLADFKLQYVLVATCLFIVASVVGRKKEAILALALLIANGETVYSQWMMAGENPTALKIVSFNINFRKPETDPGLEFLARENADVVVVTEVTEAWRAAFKRIKDIYPHQFFGPAHQGEGEEPHWIGLLAKQAWLESGFEWSDVSARAYAVWARFPANSPSLTVVGVHLNNPRFQPTRYQKAEVKALASMVEGLVGPVVVAGDFNMTPYSTRYRRLLKDGGLRRASGRLNTTWPSLLTPLGLALDHLLVSAKVKHAAMRVGPSLGSDHRPIVGTFEVGQ